MKRTFLIVFCVFATLLTKAQTKDVPDLDKIEIHEDVDSTKLASVEPEFPGGLDKFFEYLNKNVSTIHGNFHGRVYASFILNKEGSITEAKIVSDKVPNTLANRIVEVLNNSPKWKPAIRFGKPANIKYTIPLTFN